MRKSIYFGLFLIPSLVFSFLDEGLAVRVYNLDENSIEERNGKVVYASHAVFRGESLSLPPDFLNHTNTLINREHNLRKSRELSESLNVVQFCFYGLYENQECILFEDMPFPQCRGVFYLSGNTPVQLSEKKKTEGNFVEVQDITLCNQGIAKVIQRIQPLVNSMEKTVGYLANIKQYITNTNQNIDELAKHADKKHAEFFNFRIKQTRVIKSLDYISRSKKENPQLTPLQKALEIFSGNFVGELKASLEEDDFGFCLLGKAKENKAVSTLIKSIQETLSERDINSLLNSKHFNLGCSEQLLLYHLSTEMKRNFLAQKLIKNFKNEGLKDIWLQIHSTKTPCKACLIGCCGHISNGWISSLFQKINQKMGVPLHLIISYEKAYSDKNDYGFSVPVVDSFSEVRDKILLVNSKDTYLELLISKEYPKLAYYLLLSDVPANKQQIIDPNNN